MRLPGGDAHQLGAQARGHGHHLLFKRQLAFTLARIRVREVGVAGDHGDADALGLDLPAQRRHRGGGTIGHEEDAQVDRIQPSSAPMRAHAPTDIRPAMMS